MRWSGKLLVAFLCIELVVGSLSDNSTSTGVIPVHQTPKRAEVVEISENDDEEQDTNPDEEQEGSGDSQDGLSDGKIRTEIYTFDGKVKNYIYLNRDSNKMTSDETIVVLTDHNKVYLTHDQGSTWERISPDEEILQIQLNEFNNDDIYLIASHSKVIYSQNRGYDWKSFRTPVQQIPGLERSLYFHPLRPLWLIWVGETGCDSSMTCRNVLYVSRAYGKRWSILQENVNQCQFLGNLQKRTHPNFILCERPATESNDFVSELLYSTDFFQTKTVVLQNIVGFTQSDQFLIAATHENDELKAHVSLNGRDWVDSYFPLDYSVKRQQSYTILSGITKAVLLHLTTNDRAGTEYGSILKSNADGQDFVTLIDHINRNTAGYVDFEQMEGLEGIMIVNSVVNWKDSRLGAKKQLKSMITYNDGAHWEYLNPPVIDSNKEKYSCDGKSLAQCSLNLHGFSERSDPRDTLSSGSLIGMMIGVGNVGETLANYYDSNTFFTRDGGVTWKEIKKGVYMWEYGDQGSIIVLVNEKENTNIIYYSMDEGDNWHEFKFNEDKVQVLDILTVPSDNSRKFLLFTRLPLHGGDKTRVYQIDFSNYYTRQCSLDLRHPDVDDFEMWTPKHPFQPDNCLFGHQLEYYRKIPGRDCFIGNKLYNDFQIVRNCSCSKQDFECDFNYYRDSEGICRLIPGFSPPDHSLQCQDDPRLIEYSIPTGYRKLQLSTCAGGLTLDQSEMRPCPGQKDSFNSRHRNTGKVLLTVLIVLSCTFVGYILFNYYQNLSGSIRLDDEANFEFMDNYNVKDEVSYIVKFGLDKLVDIFKISKQYSVNLYEKLFNKRINLNTTSDAYIVSDDFDEENEFLNNDASLISNSNNDDDDDDNFIDDRVQS